MFMSRPGTALPVDQRLGSIHHLVMGNRRARIIKRLLNLGPEPGVVGFAVHGQASRQAAFGGNTGQQDAHGIRECQADASQGIGGSRLELIVYTDMKH